MKISGDKPYILRTYLKKSREEEKVSQGEKKESGSLRPDKVELSKKAREKQFREIRRLVDEASDVREEKMAVLRNAIEDGTYRVKGKEVAKKMLKESIDEFV
jgi:negative regulator of flagellin synthesis FlgM